MTGYRLSPAARDDLASIWRYSRERWGECQDDAYYDEITAAMNRVADAPSRGRQSDEVREGYRQIGIGSHRIFFVETAHGIDVVRILHQRMDADRHL